MREIIPNVYYAGVLNPNMRVFDVIMYTDYGTSYNSYIVKGSEKTALIEGSHRTFLENFTENIEDAIGDAKIDYLILNHTEPDHSGAVADLLEIYPDLTIIGSAAAGIYLKNITNIADLNFKAVKTGDSISLGDKTLEFINAPFLHWPDSQFTYLKEDKILFSCDFLGCHYCEPQLYDHRVVYPDKYWDALKYYFDVIFGPFNKFVIQGLDKIKDLEIEMVCNSHGPILTKEGFLDEVIDLYHQWSTPKTNEKPLIPVFYTTAYGNTKKLGEEIAKGVKSVMPDAEIDMYNVIEHDMGDLHQLVNDSDAMLVGPLTINRDAVPPIYELLAGIDAVNFVNKPVALFGSFGWSGEAFTNVASRLEGIKAKVFPEPYKVNFVPSEDELKGAFEYGVEFAKSLNK